MAVKITGVETASTSEKHGIKAGDKLLKINGHAIKDVLDYRFYVTEKQVRLELEATDGTVTEKQIKKREYDDLGLEFETYLMDKQRFCKNKCMFCFIDQMPKGLRESLYFKDDDSRMSFLFGNYITLTNLTDDDIDRIISMKTSPVNISVHTMNPDLRVKMMKNPSAGTSLRFIKRLTDAGIKVNAQLVLCPEINDGTELEFSLRELSALAPNVQSVAIVPVGLTKFREKLPELRLFRQDEASNVLGTIKKFAAENFAKHGTRICHAADEFYLLAKRDFPDYDAYEDFNQLENGVGLLPLLQHEFADAIEETEAFELNRHITIATGVAAAPALNLFAEEAMKRFNGLKVTVTPIENEYLGTSRTVAGLVTATDIIDQLKGKELGDELLIPAVMLRHERDLFLDSISVDEVAKALGCNVRAVENDGYELLTAMIGD